MAKKELLVALNGKYGFEGIYKRPLFFEAVFKDHKTENIGVIAQKALAAYTAYVVAIVQTLATIRGQLERNKSFTSELNRMHTELLKFLSEQEYKYNNLKQALERDEIVRQMMYSLSWRIDDIRAQLKVISIRAKDELYAVENVPNEWLSIYRDWFDTSDIKSKVPLKRITQGGGDFWVLDTDNELVKLFMTNHAKFITESKKTCLGDATKAKKKKYDNKYQKVFERIVFGEHLPPHKEPDTKTEARIYEEYFEYIYSQEQRSKSLEKHLAFMEKAKKHYGDELNPPNVPLYRGIRLSNVGPKSVGNYYLNLVVKQALSNMPPIVKKFKTGVGMVEFVVLDATYTPYYGIESWSTNSSVASSFAHTEYYNPYYVRQVQGNLVRLNKALASYYILMEKGNTALAKDHYDNARDELTEAISGFVDFRIMFMLAKPDQYSVGNPKMTNKIADIALGSNEDEVTRFGKLKVKCSLLYPKPVYDLYVSLLDLRKMMEAKGKYKFPYTKEVELRVKYDKSRKEMLKVMKLL